MGSSNQQLVDFANSSKPQHELVTVQDRWPLSIVGRDVEIFWDSSSGPDEQCDVVSETPIPIGDASVDMRPDVSDCVADSDVFIK